MLGPFDLEVLVRVAAYGHEVQSEQQRSCLYSVVDVRIDQLGIASDGEPILVAVYEVEVAPDSRGLVFSHGEARIAAAQAHIVQLKCTKPLDCKCEVALRYEVHYQSNDGRLRPGEPGFGAMARVVQSVLDT